MHRPPALLPVLAALALAAASPAGPPAPPHAVVPAPRAPVPPRGSPVAAPSPVIAAAGDIACDPEDPHFLGGRGSAWRCRMRDTSNLLVGRGLAAVLALGDLQYEDGSLAKFRASFDPTWGRVKPLLRPVPGNHEYNSGGRGYFGYFGRAAGAPGRTYYSFDLGAWHLVALDSNCQRVGCGPGSPQERWLAADLAAHRGRCLLAYWHHPLFSSARHGPNSEVAPFWRDLYAAGADVVLNGHDHVYERFAPQTPAGRPDPARGIRQLIVGTGGKNHTWFRTVAPNSEARNASTFGVLELTLHPGSYAWRFLPAGGRGFTDAGEAACHAAHLSAPAPAARR